MKTVFCGKCQLKFPKNIFVKHYNKVHKYDLKFSKGEENLFQDIFKRVLGNESEDIMYDAKCISQKIIELCAKFPDGINIKVLKNHLPNVDLKLCAKSLNFLINKGKLDFLLMNYRKFNIDSADMNTLFLYKPKLELYHFLSYMHAQYVY